MNAILSVAMSCALLAAITAAQAADYPVSGAWTYNDPDGEGAAKTCPKNRRMTFLGNWRRDTGTSVPEYRNLTLDRFDDGHYRVTDQFSTVQISGKISYTLSVTDPDHLQIRMDANGALFKLRRCAT
jgi:hypothetical protein